MERALHGRLEEHHRFLLGVQLRRIEAMEANVAELDQRLREKLAPGTRQMRLLRQIPGVDWVIAATIIAEIGVEMNAFVNAAHLASWATTCPGDHESAGRQRGGKTRKGNVHLKTALVMAGQRRRQDQGNLPRRQIPSPEGAPWRLASGCRHRPQILVLAYRMLADGSDYKDLRGGHFDQLNNHRGAGNMVRRLRQTGYDVQISLDAT